MKHLDLFSGIGGFALACQWAGIETIGFVEIDKYCQKVLRKHWPNVPIVEDIRDVKKIKAIANSRCFGQEKCQEQATGIEQCGKVKEIVANATATGLERGNLQQVSRIRCGQSGVEYKSGSQPRGEQRPGIGKQAEPQPAILITAGFPCQPFSVAGKRGSTEDDRYLWPETLTVIKAIKPEWVLLENVTGIINLALDTVLSDLEGAGYAYETLIIPACAVNAWHRRDRVWIIAYSERARTWQNNGGIRQGLSRIIGGQESATANSSINGLEGQKPICQVQQSPPSIGYSGENWWAVEPELGRVAHGIPNRVDRLKCLGNAIVPQVAYEILKVIASFEEIQEIR